MIQIRGILNFNFKFWGFSLNICFLNYRLDSSLRHTFIFTNLRKITGKNLV